MGRSDLANRPLDANGARVNLDALASHCKTHNISTPGCFCPILIADQSATFTESAIVVESSGPFKGEYTAQCAARKCKFLSESPYILLLNELSSYPWLLQYLSKIFTTNLEYRFRHILLVVCGNRMQPRSLEKLTSHLKDLVSTVPPPVCLQTLIECETRERMKSMSHADRVPLHH